MMSMPLQYLHPKKSITLPSKATPKFLCEQKNNRGHVLFAAVFFPHIKGINMTAIKFFSSLILTFSMFSSGCNKMILKNASVDPHISFKSLQSMNEIMPHISSSDLIIFDIDHTILQATSLYCHSNWFYDHYEEALAQGHDEKDIIEVLAPIWEMSQKSCPVESVEPFTPALIKKIQTSGKKTIALTSRSENIVQETIDQLSSLGIDFSKSAPNQENFVMKMSTNVLVSNGIIFTSDYNTKGDVLKEYLKQTGFRPKSILFVDDGIRNLSSVFEVASANGIKVDCFHYPLVKRNPLHWDKKNADLAWEQRHGKIIF
jgi:hypothetical protein